MRVIDLIGKRRTIRRFKPTRIEYETLKTIVDAGRLAPSASNIQPIEYIIVDDPDLVLQLFRYTKWAGYLPEHLGRPPSGQEPVAFIIVLLNRKIKQSGGEHDVGAAMENMILAALEQGIGSCWIASVDRNATREIFAVPEYCDIDCVLALGYANEDPVIEDLLDSVKYYRDKEGRLHVPKRTLASILSHNKYNLK